MCKFRLGVSVSEFWQLTFYEFWALYEVIEPKKEEKPMTGDDVRSMEKRFLDGNFRRTGSQPSS